MIDSIIDLLQSNTQNPSNERVLIEFGGQLASLCPAETNQLLQSLIDFAEKNPTNDWPRPLMMLFSAVPVVKLSSWLENVDCSLIEALYRVTPPDQILRSQLLAMLSCTGSLDSWVHLICHDPPTTSDRIAIAFATILTDDSSALSESQLSDLVTHGTKNPAVAASIYELANREFRERHIDNHPASERLPQICELTGNLITRLEIIEEGRLPAGSTPESVAQIVQESVSLIIACMDTMALLKYEPAIVKMSQAIELKHRRLQVEAAAGMARLDSEDGKKKLIELAQHPVIRPRVIAYATEIGIEKDISLEHRGTIAQAESELALWLAMPEQMGLAPTGMKLVEQRKLYWPSYEEPLECYLFEFTYGAGDAAYCNIGISGPLTHAFTARINHLSHRDQYSAFAGWQTVSEEIFQIPLERAQEVMSVVLDKLKRKLAECAFQDVELKMLASFFGEYVLIASGTENDVSGTRFVSESDSDWIDSGDPTGPVDWQLAFDIWKGRKLLTSFNPSFAD